VKGSLLQQFVLQNNILAFQIQRVTQKFKTWYAEQISAQLEDEADVENTIIEPIDLTMAVMKEVSASWLIEMWDYISDNPQFIINGFLHAGISKTLDGDNSNIPVQHLGSL